MKRMIGLFLGLIMLVGILGNQVYAGDYRDKFYLEINGEVHRYNGRIVSIEVDKVPVVTGDMPGIIIDGRTLVPAREVFESDAVKATVEWQSATQEVYITYKDKLIILKINSDIAYVNGQEVKLDVPAMLIRDMNKEYAKTMIPFRFVGDCLGFEVDWDSDTYTAMYLSKTFAQSGHDRVDENEDYSSDEAENSSNDDIDQTDNEEEKLDVLSADKALRELPTALRDYPIYWAANSNVDDTTALEEEENSENSNELIEEEHDLVSVYDVGFDNEGGINRFTIKASGPMSKVAISEWNGRFIFDIHNALFELDEDESSYQLSYTDNPILNAVRSSQQEPLEDGTEVLRIVFDMKNSNTDYKLYFNEDRTQLIYEMESNQLIEMTVGQNDKGDYIDLMGNAIFDIETFRLSNRDRLVFDLNHTASLVSYKEQREVEGQYIDTVRTAQFDYETTRVVVETFGQADYEIEALNGRVTRIQFVEPSYSNVTYDNTDKPNIILDTDDDEIVADEIVYKDLYNERKFIITLPGNYKELFGEGEININDSVIESVEIVEDEAGNTSFIINEKGIYVFRIENVDGNISIRAHKPKEIYSKIVIIDPGHGGKDPGAVVPEMTENELNMKITAYLVEIFGQDESIKTYFTRVDDRYVSLQDRCDMANSIEADLFISVHNNAYYSNFHGTETLYFKDDETDELDSVDLAEIAQKNMVATLGLDDRGEKARNTLYVLKNTSMPAIIIEGGFMTNPIDIAHLIQPEVQRKFAEAVYATVLEVFEKYPTGRKGE